MLEDKVHLTLAYLLFWTKLGSKVKYLYCFQRKKYVEMLYKDVNFHDQNLVA